MCDSSRRPWALGYSDRDIAAELDKSYTWTNRHISEGLRRLREVLGWEPISAEQLRQQALSHPLVAKACGTYPASRRS